ncbi:MAG: hypothetical protein SPH22_06205 [Prevotella sp.]|nr:hypothetical protein [Prevotella sp.]MDY5289225.1 hypothetical protein [Prevotella sp.]
MQGQITNFARFYTILNRMPYVGDKEDLKRELVLQGTNGRTNSLREVSKKEYAAICEAMERVAPGIDRDKFAEQLRKSRSVCLRLMQKIGVDTTSWRVVNDYCKSPKIAGADFRVLSIDDLDRLSLKLRMILKKQSDK